MGPEQRSKYDKGVPGLHSSQFQCKKSDTVRSTSNGVRDPKDDRRFGVSASFK